MSTFSRPCRLCSSLLSLSFSPLPAGEWKGDGRGAGGEVEPGRAALGSPGCEPWAKKAA